MLGRYSRFRTGMANSVLRLQDHNRQDGNCTASFQLPVRKSYHPRNFNEQADSGPLETRGFACATSGHGCGSDERGGCRSRLIHHSHLARPSTLGLTISRRTIQIPAKRLPTRPISSPTTVSFRPTPSLTSDSPSHHARLSFKIPFIRCFHHETVSSPLQKHPVDRKRLRGESRTSRGASSRICHQQGG